MAPESLVFIQEGFQRRACIASENTTPQCCSVSRCCYSKLADDDSYRIFAKGFSNHIMLQNRETYFNLKLGFISVGTLIEFCFLLFLIQGDLAALLGRKGTLKTMTVVRLALHIARSISQLNELIRTIILFKLNLSC